jgi:hypothetical protein
MGTFVEAYPAQEYVQQPAAQMPWFLNFVILDKIKIEQLEAEMDRVLVEIEDKE